MLGYLNRSQAEDRLIHLNKHRPITLWDLEALQTIDTTILEALAQKHKAADSLIRVAGERWLKRATEQPLNKRAAQRGERILVRIQEGYHGNV